MIAAVILAGGSGLRMQSELRKQYLELDGIPVIGHTLMAFDRCFAIDRMVLVLPSEDIPQIGRTVLNRLVLEHDIEIVAGGQRRQDSVCNGLTFLGNEAETVLIHDGVRPFVRQSLIRSCLQGVAATGACIPAIPATDTLKRVDEDNTIVGTLDRQGIQCAQTPQTFDTALIRRAHRLARQNRYSVTDDASVAELAGERVTVIPGDSDNIKVTHPPDLALARAILARWQEERGGR
ncbi:MAG: 2-C-methyl-D-erythritol 4-phosphate cytidylyltransferase [Proteobacteria bacterium]|nr:MAG: 2-C-methyl-D-erythritol 4-phosphate cytidylyltransferase [Pseudomonadota bacterium]PIE67260.1 MAG: 2-C-methyl-D-erythritol 4-phosphate cytidylyltransferase [Deltaproteobacteria bacterium]